MKRSLLHKRKISKLLLTIAGKRRRERQFDSCLSWQTASTTARDFHKHTVNGTTGDTRPMTDFRHVTKKRVSHFSFSTDWPSGNDSDDERISGFQQPPGGDDHHKQDYEFWQ